MATITKEGLLKQAGVIKNTGRIAAEAAKLVDSGLGYAGRTARKGVEKAVDVLHTANKGKLKTFEDAHLGMKTKDGGGVVGKFLNRKHNADIEAKRTAFRKMSTKDQVEHVRSVTGSDSIARQYATAARTQKITRGTLAAGAGAAVGTVQYKKYKKRKAEQEAVAQYYRNQGYY